MRAGLGGRHARLLAAAATTLVLSACGTGLDSMPLPSPGGTTSGGVRVTAIFADALNLPSKAKVKLGGADIGEVEDISTRNFNAYVTMRIQDGVQLSRGSTAELRSATPLGDVFVSIKPPAQIGADRGTLHDGDTIALDATSAAATVEQTLSSAALLVNGGAIRQLTSIFNGAGAAVGGRGANIGDLLKQTNTLISNFNSRSDQINAALHSSSELAATVTANQGTLNQAIAAADPATSVVADNTARIADLTDTAGRITAQLSRFPSMAGTDSRSTIADLNHLADALNTISVDPNVSLTSMNRLIGPLLKFTNSSSVHVDAEFKQLALGSLPDKNYPGDPGFHGPDGTDWHALIGSLRYEWNLLLNKVNGANR